MVNDKKNAFTKVVLPTCLGPKIPTAGKNSKDCKTVGSRILFIINHAI